MRPPGAARIEPVDVKKWVDKAATQNAKNARLAPEALNVAPELVGLPLATPGRRAVAMAIDLAVVGLLTGISGLWLWVGLALVLLQLRNRQRQPGRSKLRVAVGWAGVALVLTLALQEAGSQLAWWQDADERAAAAVADKATPAGAGEADAAEDAAALVAAAAASAPPLPASASASAALQAAQRRIEVLETQLAEARKPQRTRLRDHVSRLLDDIGAGLGWGIVYFSLLPAWWAGQTVGKKLMRLRVLELTGKPITVMRALKRYGGYAAGLATGGLGFIQALWDPNRQGLHDKAAHTVVVDLRPPRLAPGPPTAPVLPAADAPRDPAAAQPAVEDPEAPRA